MQVPSLVWYSIAFYPRDAMLAQYMLWLCVCLSVHPSVRCTPELCRNSKRDWTDRAHFWRREYPWLILHFVITKFGYLQK